MKKSTLATLCMAGFLMMSGCSSNSVDGAASSKGPSSGDSKSVGSLSGGENAAPAIEGETWTSIEIDLNQYLRGERDRVKSYDMQMVFDGKHVNVEADCYNITARYKLKDGELSFSRISSPKSVDRASCQGFEHADDAVLAFFSSDYSVLDSSTPKAIALEATDLDAAVTLKR